jgi:hypothetical protein
MAFSGIRKAFTAAVMATFAIGGAITVAAAPAVSAAGPDGGTASAFGLHVTLLGGNILGPIPAVTLPADGSPVQLAQTLPISVPGLLTANTLNAAASSTHFGQANEDITASAGVEGDGPIPGLSIAKILDVHAVESVCNSSALGSVASTTIVSLSIGGAPPLVLPSPIPPNTGLTAANLGPLAGLVTITLNAQTGSDHPGSSTSITVDAIKVTLLSALGSAFNTSVTVAESSCTATGPDIEVPPTVTSITPKFGPTAGDTPVTITGNDFFPGSTVTFGGVPATDVTVVSPTEITADSPAHAAGTVDVRVGNPFGLSAISAADQFTYEAPPTIAVNGITPLFGPSAGGTSVTITGTNFGPDSTVTFGPNASTNVTVNSSTQITAVTPPGVAGPVPVTVKDAGGSATAAQDFTYVAPPTISSFTPMLGPTSGGTHLTITGTGYAGPATVEIGGVFATNVVVVNPTTITANTPAHAAGAFFVTVADPGGSVVSTGKFTFVPAPNTLSFTPTAGPTTGGTVVTITATSGLTDTTSVTFGGVPASIVPLTNTDTSVQVVTPAHAAGPVPVAVTSIGGGPVTAPGSYTYVLAPVEVNSVVPDIGPTAGGTHVVITGQGFTTASAVTFGGTNAASYSVISDTQINAVTPPHAAGTFNVIVTSPGGTSFPVVADQFTFEATPTVTSISPTSGPTTGGTTVTLTGTNFGPDSVVTFSGAPGLDVTVAPNGTQLTVVTPAHAAGPTTVTVTDGGGSANAPSPFTFVGVPVITGVNPNKGPTLGGNTVTITGSGFTGTTSVTFGGNAATNVHVTNDTTMTVTVPAGNVGTVSVSVTTPGGTGTLNNAYTYVAAPTITSFTPVVGPTSGGTVVTITGTNLTGTTSVTFGGASNGSPTNVNSSTVTALTPAHAAGGVAVAVTTPGGTVTASQLYTYLGPPVVNPTGINPHEGPTAGGTTVTITGSDLTGTTNVTFGTTPGTDITNISDNEITVVDPAHAAGSVNVNVTATGGTATAPQQFTYVAPASLSTIVPNSGPTSGGTSVTITGSGFTGATSATFDGTPATSFSVVNDTHITAVTPAGVAGNQPVVVNNLAGPSNALAFDYIAAPVVGANGLNPAFGPTAGGTTVTISGSDLTGTTAVTFGGLAGTSINNISDTSISVVDPAHGAGSVPVVVTAAGGSATAAQQFTYVATPTISALNPNAGPVGGGTVVTITGTGFAGPTTVAFGANQATGVTVVSATTITAIAPASTTGLSTVNVSVTDVGGTSGNLPYTYVAAPQVTGISPTSGPLQGGEPVTIKGANLCNTPSGGVPTVDFGANQATVTAVSADCTTLTVTEPAGQGTVPVTVTTEGGTARSPENFTYIQPGYWEAASDGGVFAFGGAAFLGSVPGVLKPGQSLNSPIVAMADTPDHGGYWLYAADGGVFAFGDAPFFGSIPGVLKPGQVLNGPVVTAEATPDGHGYRMFAADGGVFDFGDAAYEGGLPGENIFPSSPVAGAVAYPFASVGILPFPGADTAGYWLAAANGTIYSFGNAPSTLGSGAGQIFGQVVALATTPDGEGYYMFLQGGGVAAFGDGLKGLGSAVSAGAPIVFGQSTSTGKGYWEFASNGGVFSFGDAPFEGSLTIHLNKPITAAIAFGSM